ncbi:hypothetical protein BY996DRAFT_8694325 [Phakopsora pachyrhizi]|nr:hypothetical protein BY996DRAFT_8694325 [Phakopsora pachyrhizi]
MPGIVDDLMRTGLFEAFHEIQKIRSNTQELAIGSSNVQKFNLNELPRELDLVVSHDDFENLSKIGSDGDYGLTSKGRREELEPFRTIPSSSMELNFDTSSHQTSFGNFGKTQVNVGFGNEKDFHYVSKKQRIENIHQSNERKRLAILQSSSINSIQGSFVEGKEKSIQGIRFNRNYITISSSQENKSDRSSGESSELKAYQSAKIEGKDKITLTKKKRVILNASEFIKKHMSAEIIHPGPFDIEGAKTHRSPYNRELLHFIENNLDGILPEVLSDYRITGDFLANIKSFFWNEEEGIFMASEESFESAIKGMESLAQSAGGIVWIEYSETGMEKSKKATASAKFAFRTVFAKYYKYENFSRFLFTKGMRQKGKIFFEQLEERLLTSSKRLQITKANINTILRQVWNRMTSFMAYVHAINAIISPDPLEPLTHEQLIQRQEEALEFFIELHKDFENLYKKTWLDNRKRILPSLTEKELEVEEKKQEAISVIFNSLPHNDVAVWLYIELYLIKRRTSLFSMSKKASVNETKFKSLLNRIVLLLFAGMDASTKLIEAKQPLKI